VAVTVNVPLNTMLADLGETLRQLLRRGARASWRRRREGGLRRPGKGLGGVALGAHGEPLPLRPARGARRQADRPGAPTGGRRAPGRLAPAAPARRLPCRHRLDPWGAGGASPPVPGARRALRPTLGEPHRIGGVVRDAGGEPVADAWVVLPDGGAWAVTDAQGRFLVERLAGVDLVLGGRPAEKRGRSPATGRRRWPDGATTSAPKVRVATLWPRTGRCGESGSRPSSITGLASARSSTARSW